MRNISLVALAIGAFGCGEVLHPGPGEPDAGTTSGLAKDGSVLDSPPLTELTCDLVPPAVDAP